MPANWREEVLRTFRAQDQEVLRGVLTGVPSTREMGVGPDEPFQACTFYVRGAEVAAGAQAVGEPVPLGTVSVGRQLSWLG